MHEIFVLRAPVFGPKAHPPARCKPLKNRPADCEVLMERYEQAVETLEAALRPQ